MSSAVSKQQDLKRKSMRTVRGYTLKAQLPHVFAVALTTPHAEFLKENYLINPDT